MTIKDIAKLCNVSVSTVSRVLNDRPDVSEDVRRKVLSAIKDSNYIPNNSARDLVAPSLTPSDWWYAACPTRFTPTSSALLKAPSPRRASPW